MAKAGLGRPLILYRLPKDSYHEGHKVTRRNPDEAALVSFVVN